MTPNSALHIAAALCGSILAVSVLIGKRFNVARGCFCAGMLSLAASAALPVLFPDTADPSATLIRHTLALILNSFLPGFWLCFSLTWARGNYREFLAKWKILLPIMAIFPVLIAVALHNRLVTLVPLSAPGGLAQFRYGTEARLLNFAVLLAAVAILMNLEQTLRASVGTMRWRVKFVVMGLFLIFGAKIYTLSQALLFRTPRVNAGTVESAALIVACVFMVLAYVRQGFAEIDVYPSHAFLQGSVTLLLVGAYLFIVGGVAQALAYFGGIENFEVRALLLLAAIAALAVMLLSDRMRQRIGRFVSRHLKRPTHDFRKVWTRLSISFGAGVTPSALCDTAAKLISQTFAAQSITIWLCDDHDDRLVLEASTSQTSLDNSAVSSSKNMADAVEELRTRREPFDPDAAPGKWAQTLRELNPAQFRTGGNRFCVPLSGAGRFLGVVVLADRVNGAPYTVEEIELLECIAEQTAAALLNLRLTEELMLAKQLEAFQTMSTFFVHDLKNAANSLSLMVQNLPLHYNDPAFREDALRGMAITVGRINELIARLTLLRNKLDLNPVPSDLNELVSAALKSLNGMPNIQLQTDLQPLPPVLADREKVQSVVTNLLLNAQDAVGPGGKITVGTTRRGEIALLSVSDDGCGMSPAFLRDGLFRPFQTTKKKGLGIGMFQARIIVAAHKGSIQVASEQGKGTTFRVSLPVSSEAR